MTALTDEEKTEIESTGVTHIAFGCVLENDDDALECIKTFNEMAESRDCPSGAPYKILRTIADKINEARTARFGYLEVV